MLGAAVGAPAGPDVKDKGLALEAGGLDRTPVQQIVDLPRRQGTPERCLILAVGIVAKAEPKQGAEDQGQQQWKKEAQAGSHNASSSSRGREVPTATGREASKGRRASRRRVPPAIINRPPSQIQRTSGL